MTKKPANVVDHTMAVDVPRSHGKATSRPPRIATLHSFHSANLVCALKPKTAASAPATNKFSFMKPFALPIPAAMEKLFAKNQGDKNTQMPRSFTVKFRQESLRLMSISSYCVSTRAAFAAVCSALGTNASGHVSQNTATNLACFYVSAPFGM
jgi:uncharacterized MAPEG superfamily protein